MTVAIRNNRYLYQLIRNTGPRKSSGREVIKESKDTDSLYGASVVALDRII